MGGSPSYGVAYLIYNTETGKWLTGTPQQPRWTDNAQMARRYRTKAHLNSSLGADDRYRKDKYPDTWVVVEMEMRFGSMYPLDRKFTVDK